MNIKSNTDYLGRVIYIDDPTFSGRCKVKVYGLFDDLDENFIPWFVPMNNSVFGTSGGGSISVPKLGDIVRVRFPNGDPYSGEYTSCQNIDPDLIDEIKDDYRDTQVLVYDSENDLLVAYQNLSGLRLYLKGSQIKIDADGTIQLKHKNNSNLVEINNDTVNIVNENGNGEINIKTTSTVNISAPTVNVDSENVNLGTNPAYKAVKGEELIKVLEAIRDELMTKYPIAGSALMGRTFEEILSNSVNVTE